MPLRVWRYILIMSFLRKNFKRILPITLAFILISTICFVSSVTPSASGTGAGLAEWALNAYKEHWKYVYGGQTPGEVDCSGLIYSYCGGERGGTAQLNTATESGDVSEGIPRIHGLGLYQPGHVGVYVGNGMAVDARDEESNMCYQSTATKSWTKWFKLAAINYPTTGWVKCDGKYYYYDNGEYVVNTERKIGGVEYKFDDAGVSDRTPDDIKLKAETTPTQPVTEKPDAVVMKLGSKGEDVTKLQNRLSKLGFYSGEITGYFGEATEDSFKDYQKAAGVTMDGEVKESDIAIIYSDDAPRFETIDDVAQLGDAGDDVKSIQQQLAKLEYFNGSASGYYGKITEFAVKQFQKDNNIDTSGIVGKYTKDKLFSKKAVKKSDLQEKSEKKAAKKTAEKTEKKTAVKTAAASNKPAKVVNKDAKSGVKVAKTVALKTNTVSKKALANTVSSRKAASLSVTDEKNTSFVLWLGIVIGIVLVVSGLMFVLNRRRKAVYVGTHTRGAKRGNVTVRYW